MISEPDHAVPRNPGPFHIVPGWDAAPGTLGGTRDLGYGYQWWSATAFPKGDVRSAEGGRVPSTFGILRRVGDRYFNYASGHGGQLIVLLVELDMVIVAAADPFWQQHDDESWKHERAINNLVAKFIKSLPKE